MATQHHTVVRNDSDNSDVRGVLLAVAYGAGIIATIGLATGAAVLLASFTQGLGQFILLAGVWLFVVSASPEISKRSVRRLDVIEFSQRAPRSSRAVQSAVAYLVAKQAR